MATDGKDHAVQSTGRVRTAALQGPGRPPAVGKDPAVLAADIERTREELAGTIAAIADRVSPKLVAQRTRQRVEESARETATKVEDRLRTGTAAAVEAAKAAADQVKERMSGQPAPERPQRTIAVGSSTRVRPAAQLTGEPHVAASSTSERVGSAPNPLPQDTVTIPVSSAGALADATPPPVAAPPGAELTSPSRPVAASVLSYRPAQESMTPIYAGAAAALAALLLLLRRRRR